MTATFTTVRERQRGAAASLIQPAGRHLHWLKISGSKSCQLWPRSKPRQSPDLKKSNKTVCKYRGPEHQQGDVPAEVEGKTGAKHEQHQAQERLSLFRP